MSALNVSKAVVAAANPVRCNARVNRRVAAALMLSCLTLSACGGSPTTPAPQTATLSGTVHVLGASTLVPDATVTCEGKSTTTSASGAFSLSGLTPGSATVDITKAGFKPARIVVMLAVGVNSFSIAIEPE